MKGTYILVIHLDKKEIAKVGSLGRVAFPPGYYLYVGSALNSLDKRIERHISTNKKIKWHIDYLTTAKSVIEINAYYIESTRKEECNVAQRVAQMLPIVVEKFGSTDCNCESHLFYAKNEMIAKTVAKMALGKGVKEWNHNRTSNALSNFSKLSK